MEQTYYKCLCCGFFGERNDFGIPLRLDSTNNMEFNYCPSCGSIDILPIISQSRDVERYLQKEVLSL